MGCLITFGGYKYNHRLTTTKDVHFLYPEAKSKALILSFDDGNILDTQIVSTLNHYHLKGTFFLHTAPLIQSSQKHIPLKLIAQLYDGHEVGSHGVSHLRLNEMNDSLLWYELNSSKDTLEKYLNKAVYSLAYPFGDYNSKTIEMAKQAGYTNARSISNTNLFKPPVDFLQWHPTCALSEAIKNREDFLNTDLPWVRNLKSILGQQLNIPYSWSKMQYTWGHATDFSNPSGLKIDDFEVFCSAIKSQNNIWSCTSTEATSYFQSIQKLIITKYEIANPVENTQSVWFSFADKEYVIQPGETFSIHETLNK